MNTAPLPSRLPQLADRQMNDEHDELLRLILAFQHAAPSQLVSALDDLRRLAGVHFASEDQDLRRLGGNNADCHVDEHAAVLKSLDEVRQMLSDAATPADVVQRLHSGLSNELLRWLPEHVGEMDASIATERAKERLGGVPVRITRPVRA
jgi:hemerythrin